LDADKELDFCRRMRMRAAARIWPISANRSAAVMRSGDRGFGAGWASRMETVRNQLMFGLTVPND
jgi:hypothetical protein